MAGRWKPSAAKMSDWRFQGSGSGKYKPEYKLEAQASESR